MRLNELDMISKYGHGFGKKDESKIGDAYGIKTFQ